MVNTMNDIVAKPERKMRETCHFSLLAGTYNCISQKEGYV